MLVLLYNARQIFFMTHVSNSFLFSLENTNAGLIEIIIGCLINWWISETATDHFKKCALFGICVERPPTSVGATAL